MTRQISLAHLTVLDTTPPELVSVAAAAGFRTIGIRLAAPPRGGTPPYDIHGGGGDPAVRQRERWAGPAGDAAAPEGHGGDCARHGVPALRARPAGGHPG